MKIDIAIFLCVGAACLACHAQSVESDRSGDLFTKPKGVVTRWSSFENLAARKGEGGRENQGAKGHAFDSIKPGETVGLGLSKRTRGFVFGDCWDIPILRGVIVSFSTLSSSDVLCVTRP